MITKEQREYYLKNHGISCPFCHSNELDSDPIKYDLDPSANIRCGKCGKEWTDIYKLVDIEEAQKP